jgi:RsiW-degrading membrane proteinase PrsW (M82 family)
MDVLTLLSLAIAPGAAISLFVYWKDKFDREPRRLLVWSFVLGAIATFPSLVVEVFGMATIKEEASLGAVALRAFVVVGFTEEFFKFVMLRYYAYRKKEFNEPFDGITYGVMVSMGFATLENIMYVSQYGMGNAIMRMFTAVPAHATFGIVMGYYAGLAKFSKQEFTCLAQGLVYAAILHGAYDFFLMQNSIPGLALGALVSLIIGIRFSLKAIKLHQSISPFRRDHLHDHQQSGQV